MKIAIAQLNYTIGDVDGNASKIIDSIHKAKAQHADLVIFAEQAVSGTPALDLLRKTTFLELCEDALVEIASCCDGIAAIVGLPILTADGTISAAALIQDRKMMQNKAKKYITASRQKRELSVGLYIDSDKSIFYNFQSMSQQIEEELGMKVQWREANKASRFLIERTFEIDDKQTWDDGINWLYKMCCKFKELVEKYK